MPERSRDCPRSDSRPGLSNLRLGGRLAAARLRRRPLLLSHILTARCNAFCETCLWRREPASATSHLASAGLGTPEAPVGGGCAPSGFEGPEIPGELSTAEVAWLYREAGAAGIAQVVVWGGEPLLRRDLPELLDVARSACMGTIVITNGWLLPERWPALRGRVDTLIVSLDDVGPAHDAMRRLLGLYARLDRFVRDLAVDPLRPRLLVNTVLSRLNRGALRRVAPVVKEWGAGLYFCPMETGEMTSAGFKDAKGSLALASDELREAARLARELSRAGYPLLATDRYLGMLERDPRLTGYRCCAPHATLTVQPDGIVRDCLRRDVPLADLCRLRSSGGHLAEVLRSAPYLDMLARAGSCTVCNNPDVLETSWAWRLRPSMVWRTVQLAALGRGTLDRPVAAA